MGLYDNDIIEGKRRILSKNAFGLYDSPEARTKATLDSQRLQYSRYDWELRQAMAQGRITSDEYVQARDTDRSNFVQKLMFQAVPEMVTGKDIVDKESSGSTLETIGDLLSVPNYLVGAMTKATVEDPLVRVPLGEWGGDQRSLDVGFGLGAFADAWAHKTDFIRLGDDYGVFNNNPFGVSEETANFTFGLAADIFLDPTTYLTMGVSKGAQIGLKAETKAAVAGSKIAQLGDRATLSPFGTQMYRMAAQRLNPVFKQEVDDSARHLLDAPVTAEWHDRIGNYMVENFDSLRADLLKRQANGGWWARAASVVAPAGEANRAKLAMIMGEKGKKLTGYGLDDLFEETSTWASKTRGLYDVNKVQRALTSPKLPAVVTKLMANTFDIFDKGWDAPPEVVEKMRLSQYAAQEKFQAKLRIYQEEFSKLGLDDTARKTITEQIELRAVGKGTTYTDDIEKGIAFVQKEMDEILQEENVAGFATQKVEGYISHIRNPVIRKYYQTMMARNGEQLVNVENRFTQQRMIASIAEGEELFGEGAFMTDAYRILATRRRASIDMMEQDTLFNFITNKYGLPEALVNATSQGMSKGAIRGFMRKVGFGHSEVLTIDQVYQAKHGNLAKLGFKEGDAAHNRQTLDFLQRPNDDVIRNGANGSPKSGKFSEEGKVEAKRLGLPEAALMHYVEYGARDLERIARPLPSRFRFQPVDLEAFETTYGGKVTFGKEAERFDVNVAMKMMEDPNHVGWREIFRASESGDKIQLNRVQGWLAGLHKYTTRFLDSQLMGYMPDVEDRVLRAWDAEMKRLNVKPRQAGPKAVKTQAKNDAAFAAKQAKLRESLTKFTSKLAGNLEVRKVVPQLPPTLIEIAKGTRRAAGIITDEAPVTPWVRDEVRKVEAKLGFTPDVSKQLYRALFDKDKIETLADADKVMEALDSFALDAPIVNGAGKLANAKTGKVASRYANERVVPYTLRFSRKLEGNVLPEINDVNRALPASEGSLAPSSVEGAVQKTIRDANVQNGQPPPSTLRIVDRPGLTGQKASTRTRPGVADEVEDTYQAARAEIESLRGKSAKLLDELKEMRSSVPSKDAHKKALVAFRDAQKNRKTVLSSTKDKQARQAAQVMYSDAKKKLDEIRKSLTSKEGKAATAAYKTKNDAFVAVKKEYAEKVAGFKAVRESYEQARASRDTLRGGGVQDAGWQPAKGDLTPADRVKALREEISRLSQGAGRVTNGKQIEQLESKLAAERSQLIKLQGGDTSVVAGQKGLSRPDTTPVEETYLLPEGIAKLMDDYMAPDIPPELSDMAKQALRTYDSLMSYYKTNMLLPHGGYWGRQFMSNAAMLTLRTGLSFFNPKGNFRRGRDGMAAIMYALGRYSNLTDELGAVKQGKVGEWLKAMGDHTIEATNGRSIKVRDLDREVFARGVYKGMASGELFDALPPSRRISAAVSGLFAGGAAGAAAGAIVSPNDSNGASYGMAMGALVGTFLGGRGIKHGGGLPVRGMNGVTGLLQSQWKPFLRVGEATTDLPFRVAMFVNEFAETGSIQHAAEQVYRHMNDYNSLSVVERRWLRRMIPFYSWTKQAIRTTGFQVIENPGRLAAMFKVSRDWNEAHDVDPEDIPDWLHDKLSMVSKNSEFAHAAEGWLLGDKHEDKAHNVYYNFGAPVEDVANILSALIPGGGSFSEETKEFAQGIMSRASFPVATAVELSMNRDMFTGKSIEDRYSNPAEWEGAPDWLKDMVGYRPGVEGQAKATVNPMLAFVLQEIPTSRFVQIAKKVYSLDPDKRRSLDTYSLARNFLGPSAYRQDPATGRVFINKSRIEKLKTFLDNIGDLPTPKPTKTKRGRAVGDVTGRPRGGGLYD